LKVIILKDYDEISKRAAKIVADEIVKKPDMVLSLATGSSPLGLYKELIRLYKQKKLDFSKITTFNLDEYVGLSSDNKNSFYYFLAENFLNHININPKNIHLLKGVPRDFNTYCKSYEKIIKNVGGIDLQILGVGRDGHIAFNEPGSSLGSRTRVKALTEETIEDNARFFKSKNEVPRFAITMGVGTIIEAKKIILLANGLGKADIIAKSIEGPITAEITASALQMHPNTIIVIDEKAASKLKKRSYYEYVQNMEKEWINVTKVKE